MAKLKIKYVCNKCGYDSPKWLGKCPGCNEWNSFTEEIVEARKTQTQKISTSKSEAIPLSNEFLDEEVRVKTNINEFDRVLGGGLIPGSVVLLGGDPGIGKSTLVMQMADKIKGKILYVTGEESVKQINLRAARLKVQSQNILILAETNVDQIILSIKDTPIRANLYFITS